MGQTSVLQSSCSTSSATRVQVLTVSEFSKREIMNWAGLASDRVEVVYNGVGDAFTANGPARQAPPYILYVGNQRAHKNVDSLLRGLCDIDQGTRVDLAITGSATRILRQSFNSWGSNSEFIFSVTCPTKS